MDGNSNSATMVDHRPASRRNQWDLTASFRDQADVDYMGWDEPRDTFSDSQSPLGVAGFVRLGGPNRAASTARRNPTHRGNPHGVGVDVQPPTHVPPSFRPPESAVGVSCGGGHAAESLANPTASSALISAYVPPQNDTLATTPEAGCDAITGAIEVESAPELNAAPISEPSLAAAEQCPFELLQVLSKRVKAGDDSAIAQIQRILNSNDALWQHLGDVEKATEAMLIEVAEGSAASKESVRRSVAAMKQSLLSAEPTPLERMAVGRVMASWLFTHFVDRWCSWSIKAGGRASDLAKLLEASEKRYQISLKSFKLVQSI